MLYCGIHLNECLKKNCFTKIFVSVNLKVKRLIGIELQRTVANFLFQIFACDRAAICFWAANKLGNITHFLFCVNCILFSLCRKLQRCSNFKFSVEWKPFADYLYIMFLCVCVGGMRVLNLNTKCVGQPTHATRRFKSINMWVFDWKAASATSDSSCYIN